MTGKQISMVVKKEPERVWGTRTTYTLSNIRFTYISLLVDDTSCENYSALHQTVGNSQPTFKDRGKKNEPIM